MKKLVLFISIFCAFISCARVENAIDDLNDRVSKLEGEKITTIEQQINNINTSIADLEAVSDALKKQIAELEAQGDSTPEEIEALKAKDSELTLSIDSLREYVDSLNKSTKDWVAATYSTLEQYNTLSTTLANLQVALNNLKSESSAALANAISALETSMKSWVNEQLSNYYTIAQVDAKIAELQELIKNNEDETLINEINALKSSLQTLSSDLTAAYQKAISEAITESEGVISTRLANSITYINNRLELEITRVNARISDIEKRIDELEEKVDEILNRKLDITFEAENDAVIANGGTCKVHYTITSSESEVHIATIAQNGWKATITEESEKSGYITVSAPQSWSDEPIIVLVSDANTTIMRTLSFTNGITDIDVKSVCLERSKSIMKINIRTNVKYLVHPLDGWLKLREINSRAEMRNDEIIIDVEENTSPSSRSSAVELICDDVVIGSIAVYQEGATNVILYTSSNNEIIRPMANDEFESFGGKIVSNTYENGVGVITFDSDVTRIGFNAFRNCDNLTSITIPCKVTSIGPSAFYHCEGLTNIELPNEVTIIKEHSFEQCKQLSSIKMGDKLETIELYAFAGCEKLTGVSFGSNLTTIGECAFISCNSLTEIRTNNVQNIGKSSFSRCEGLTTVTLSSSLKELGWYAFQTCIRLKYIYCLPATPPAGGYYAFFGIDPEAQIVVPQASWEAYLNAEHWKDFSSMIKY